MKGSDVQEAREDPGRPDRKAYIQQKSVYRIQQKPRGREGSAARPSREAFTERPQRNHGGIQRRGDARVHERNREIASACVDGHREAVQEERDATQEVLPRTTTTLVVLKTSGTMLW